MLPINCHLIINRLNLLLLLLFVNLGSLLYLLPNLLSRLNRLSMLVSRQNDPNLIHICSCIIARYSPSRNLIINEYCHLIVYNWLEIRLSLKLSFR